MVENKLNESPYIASSLVIGSDKRWRQPSSFQMMYKFRPGQLTQKMVFQDIENLYKTKEVNQLIHKEVERINKTVAPHEQIKFFRLANDEWTTANGLLSQTLKLRRSELNAYYEKTIEEIYK